MSYFQRVKSFLFGAGMLILAAVLFLTPKEGYYVIALILGLSLFVYGFRLLWFYFVMSRYMVGGKATLYQAIIVLDLALFTSSVALMNQMIILFYLLGIFAFTGFVDILRALEAKKIGAPNWKRKLFSGILCVAMTVILVVFGLFHGETDYLVFGYCISLVVSAIIRIVSAFRKTAIVYIQ